MFAGRQGVQVANHIASIKEQREIGLWLARQFAGLPRYDAWGRHPMPKVGYVGGSWWHAGQDIEEEEHKTRVWIDEDGSIIYDDGSL